MAAYGSTTSIMLENIKQLQNKIITLTNERDTLAKQLKLATSTVAVQQNNNKIGAKPNRKRSPVKILKP